MKSLSVASLALWILASPAAAQAQSFLELGSRVGDPGTTAGGAEAFAADIDIDMLRSAPQRLALPAPDGRVLVAELSVFEDRGNGDFMWAGGFAEAGFESVVLTMRNGHLSGLFNEPGGALFRIAARPDGRGRLEDTSGMRLPADHVYCPGGVVPESLGLVPSVEAESSAGPERRREGSNHNFLDVLITYTSAARAEWASRLQTPESVSQGAVDYLNMVFRNGQLDVSARVVGVVPAPLSVTVARAGDPPVCGAWLQRSIASPRLKRLRAEYEADTVHLFIADEGTEAECSGGLAGLLMKNNTPASFSRWAYGFTNVGSLVQEQTFAHETGHNLGLHHNPEHVLGSRDSQESGDGQRTLEEYRRDVLVRPYAMGHRSDDPSLFKTVMSAGPAPLVPWFSTVREEPMGWKLGVRDERENERVLREVGLAMGVQYSDYLPGAPPPPPPPPPPGWRPWAPLNLKAVPVGSDSVRLVWTDHAHHEDGFVVERRRSGRSWREVRRLPKNTVAADIDGLTAGTRYDFQVRAYNENGKSHPWEVVTVSLPEREYADCVPSEPQIVFELGYTVSMCVEYLENGVGPLVTADAKDYGLESRESGILYFFDRDNAEVLVKVLDACALNGHRWVFVAPVTNLAFNLHIDETETGKRWTHRNSKGGVTAATKSDVKAFFCSPTASTAGLVSTADGIGGIELVQTGDFQTGHSGPPERWTTNPSGVLPPSVSAQSLATGQGTDCEPDLSLVLAGGYRVRLCHETRAGKVDDALDWGLDSRQSGLLYFFNRDNVEVLIKVLDGCGVNGHRWVFVAPVTNLAFNLVVESPEGGVWEHRGFQGLTASAKSDIRAFPCN